MRDFLYSEISQIENIPNIPDDPDLAVKAGAGLCEQVLEPIQQHLGRVSIRSGYRSPAVNRVGAANKNQYNCSRNEANYGHHIWDQLDKGGNIGATACIVVNSFIPYYEQTNDWPALAWWIHDNIPGYSSMYFHPRFAAFNVRWCEVPEKTIKSYIEPRGLLTKPGMPNALGSHEHLYKRYLQTL